MSPSGPPTPDSTSSPQVETPVVIEEETPVIEEVAAVPEPAPEPVPELIEPEQPAPAVEPQE